jgi:hypothetical protein
MIIDYATARSSDEPTSTSTSESIVQWLLHRLMEANQQVALIAERGATDAQDPNLGREEPFNQDFGNAERWADGREFWRVLR